MSLGGGVGLGVRIWRRWRRRVRVIVEGCDLEPETEVLAGWWMIGENVASAFKNVSLHVSKYSATKGDPHNDIQNE
jgi:hypothetical protein